METIDDCEKPATFSIHLKKDEDPSLFLSGLEECLSKQASQLQVLSIRRIESLSQSLINCSTSRELYLQYFAQPQNLPSSLYNMIEEVVPSKNYLLPNE